MIACLVCNAGESAIPVARRLCQELASHGVAGEVRAMALEEMMREGKGDANIVLVAPQIAYARRDVEKVVGDVIVYCVPMADYRRMNAKKIVNDVLRMVGE